MVIVTAVMIISKQLSHARFRSHISYHAISLEWREKSVRFPIENSFKVQLTRVQLSRDARGQQQELCSTESDPSSHLAPPRDYPLNYYSKNANLITLPITPFTEIIVHFS